MNCEACIKAQLPSEMILVRTVKNSLGQTTDQEYVCQTCGRHLTKQASPGQSL